MRSASLIVFKNSCSCVKESVAEYIISVFLAGRHCKMSAVIAWRSLYRRWVVYGRMRFLAVVFVVVVVASSIASDSSSAKTADVVEFRFFFKVIIIKKRIEDAAIIDYPCLIHASP